LIVNPDGLRNQIEGNVIQAISRTLKEEVTFDRSRVSSPDWRLYPILRFAEIPDCRCRADRPTRTTVRGRGRSDDQRDTGGHRQRDFQCDKRKAADGAIHAGTVKAELS